MQEPVKASVGKAATETLYRENGKFFLSATEYHTSGITASKYKNVAFSLVLFKGICFVVFLL